MAITIQVASPAQCDQVALEVGRLGLFARYGMDGEALARQLRGAPARGEQVLVACDGEQPIGFAWFLERGTLSVGGYLRLIAVAPAWQSKQVGAALLHEVERRVAAQSRALFLLVSHFNQSAQRFYARLGYEQVGRLPGFVKPDIDELLYWKRLG
ncbi:MAG TPA: GNAT family N-acetyltransferase [Polyangia bacterium]|nr:GNAT family N-acetyltransferase [Polyangia bacterium]